MTVVNYQMPGTVRWVGFLFAAYAAVANDSIQTIGTFIASNKQKPWWVLWFFIGGIFLATMGYSWSVHGGDVTYEQLASWGPKEILSQKYLEFLFNKYAAKHP